MKRRKKNLRKIPDGVQKRVQTFTDDGVVVGCVRQFSQGELAGGVLRHLGIEPGTKPMNWPIEVLPPNTSGRYSKWNREGRDIVRRDLDKVTKWYTVTVPNFGDWSKGEHDVTWSRLVYPREFEAPRELTLRVEKLTETAEGADLLLKFTVTERLNRKATDFERRLLFDLNLLQENVGAGNVYSADAKISDFMASVAVDWEILPVGERNGELLLTKLMPRNPLEREAVRARIEARRDLLSSLGPTGWVIGTSGFRRYFGAKFGEELVAFENVDYGNALYVMFGNWRQLSQLSRIELLERKEGFSRIVHRHGWERQVSDAIQGGLGSRQKAA